MPSPELTIMSFFRIVASFIILKSVSLLLLLQPGQGDQNWYETGLGQAAVGSERQPPPPNPPTHTHTREPLPYTPTPTHTPTHHLNFKGCYWSKSFEIVPDDNLYKWFRLMLVFVTLT